MQIDRKVIEGALPKKGFVEENTHHRYFYHEYKGRRTGAYTYTSHGSNYKSYGVTLLKRMKSELRLDSTAQVADLCNWPMSADQYNDHLRHKGLLSDPSSPTPRPGTKR